MNQKSVEKTSSTVKKRLIRIQDVIHDDIYKNPEHQHIIQNTQSFVVYPYKFRRRIGEEIVRIDPFAHIFVGYLCFFVNYLKI